MNLNQTAQKNFYDARTDKWFCKIDEYLSLTTYYPRNKSNPHLCSESKHKVIG